MSNSSEQFEDQAHVLRQRMHDTNSDSSEEPSNYKVSSNEQESGVNVLDLPPRSETHKHKSTGYKWKVRYPLIRLLFVLFVILILLIPIYNMWGKQGDSENGIGAVKSAKASDASYMMELTRQKDAPQSNFQTDKGKEQQKEDQKNDQANSSKSDTKSDSTSTKDGVEPEFEEYVVKEGDTLFSITMKFYNNKEAKSRIIKANHLEAEEIYAGQTLLIPQ